MGEDQPLGVWTSKLTKPVKLTLAAAVPRDAAVHTPLSPPPSPPPPSPPPPPPPLPVMRSAADVRLLLAMYRRSVQSASLPLAPSASAATPTMSRAPLPWATSKCLHACTYACVSTCTCLHMHAYPGSLGASCLPTSHSHSHRRLQNSRSTPHVDCRDAATGAPVRCKGPRVASPPPPCPPPVPPSPSPPPSRPPPSPPSPDSTIATCRFTHTPDTPAATYHRHMQLQPRLRRALSFHYCHRYR